MDETPVTVDRSRTYTWQDQADVVASIGREPGIEMIRAIGNGGLPVPPIGQTLGFGLLELGTAPDGSTTLSVTLEPAEHHTSPLGMVHGGVIATLLDTACGCAVHASLPAGVGYTSLDLSTRFLRPVFAGSGTIRATGWVVSSGRRTALAEAELRDERGRLLAHATSTCMLFPLAE